MTNDELIAAWRRKLPAIEPTERDLSAFALGVETGAALAAEQPQPVSAWHAVADWLRDNYQDHPTISDLCDAMVAAAPPPPAADVKCGTRDALESILRYGMDTLSGRADGPDDREWYYAGVWELVRRARAALDEAAKGAR